MIEFEKIYNQYFKDIYKFVLSLSRNEKIAEDITQETFLKALKNIEKFNGSCEVNVWLCQIAKNTYFSYYDKQKRYVEYDIDERVSNDNIEASLSNKEEALQIHKALHLLDEPYKEVFTLRVFGELSFAHISQIFGKTESWARVTFYRSKAKMQDKIKEDYCNE